MTDSTAAGSTVTESADSIEGKGSCLCGRVRFTARNMSRSVGACHCGMCRQWTGGPLLAIDCGTEVEFEGEENISVFDSSDWAERGFCKVCGSHLFYRFKQSQQYMMLPGAFDDDGRLVFESQIFIDRKPAFYDFANQTQNLTEAEVMEQFGPS